MHCTSCGTYLNDGARFCAGCGAPAVDPEATRVAQKKAARDFSSAPVGDGGKLTVVPSVRHPVPHDDREEQIIFEARPTLLFIKIGYAAAVLGGIALVAALTLQPFLTLPWYVLLPLGFALLLIPAYYHVRRNLVRYTLTDAKLEIDRGLIARTTRNVPLNKVQDVTVSSGLLQRLLGYGDIVIENAGESGGNIILHNIQNPRRHADLLLRELRRYHF